MAINLLVGFLHFTTDPIIPIKKAINTLQYTLTFSLCNRKPSTSTPASFCTHSQLLRHSLISGMHLLFL